MVICRERYSTHLGKGLRRPQTDSVFWGHFFLIFNQNLSSLLKMKRNFWFWCRPFSCILGSFCRLRPPVWTMGTVRTNPLCFVTVLNWQGQHTRINSSFDQTKPIRHETKSHFNQYSIILVSGLFLSPFFCTKLVMTGLCELGRSIQKMIYIWSHLLSWFLIDLHSVESCSVCEDSQSNQSKSMKVLPLSWQLTQTNSK